jgi:hypothetical protein
MADEGASSGCESVSGGGDKLLLMMVAQAISDLRHNSGELVLMRSLRIHVLRLRSTLRSSSLIKGWRRSQADQRGAGMTFLSSLLSASQRIRTFASKSYQTPGTHVGQKGSTARGMGTELKITLSKSRVPPTVWRRLSPDSPLRWTNFLADFWPPVCLISRSRAFVLLSVFSFLVNESERLTPLPTTSALFDSRLTLGCLLLARSASSASWTILQMNLTF